MRKLTQQFKMKLLFCMCKKERVWHNLAPGQGNKNPNRYRCTVCGNTREDLGVTV